MKKMFNRSSTAFLQKMGICLSMLLLFGVSRAQVVVQVGTQTASTSNNIPLTTYYGFSYSQQIYTAAEILSAGGFTGSSISKIRFYLASGSFPIDNSAGWTVYMGNTATAAYAGTTSWIPVGSMNQVFSGNVTFPSAGGAWVEVALGTPFVWDGTSNIVVAVDENTSGYSSTDTYWNTTSTGSVNRSIYYRNDNTNPDPAAPPTATGRITGYPNIQFDFVQLPCAGITPSPGNTLASSVLLCATAGNSTVLTLQNNYAANSAITYQWQSNTGSGWNDITGATANSYTAVNVSLTTQYRCNVTCDATFTGTSNPVTVTVNALPTVTVAPVQSISCTSGDVVALTASGADTYTWSPATGLSATTGATVNATVTGSATYTVTGTSTATTCSNTAVATVSTIGAYTPSTGLSPALVCASGSPVTLGVTNNPAGITLEYQWYDSTGAVVQAWGTGTSYTFTPSVDGAYKYSVKARRASCPANESQSQIVRFNAGFNATVTVNDIYCGQTAGSIVVSNPFGPGIPETWYENNFNTPALYGAQLAGTAPAAISGNRLVLTPNAGSLTGGFLIGNPNAVNPGTLKLEFDLTVGGGATNTNGADGLSWSFGPDVVAVPSGSGNGPATTNAEAGSGSGLKIGFDAYGSTFPNQAGIYLMYNCTLWDIQQTSPGVIQYVNNLTWKGGTKHVTISINELGQLTLVVGTATIFNNQQLPAAYLSADKSTWKHAFAARTGGVSEQHELDNLSIKYTAAQYGITAGGSGTPPAAWQTSNTFPALSQGSYDVYIANAANTACHKLLGTYTIGDGLTPAPGNTVASVATICANTNTTVNLTLQNSYSAYTGITWQWQSFDGTGWSNIPGATAATYSFTGLQQTTGFRCNVTCNGSLTGTSTPVTVSSVAPPTVSVTPAAVTLCTGELPTLTATGADTYTWTPNTGLSSGTGSSVQAAPTAYQQYTVTGTVTATGCSNTTTAYVTPIEFLPVTAGVTPAANCAAGTPVTLGVTSIPAYVAGSGTLEYQWLDSTGTVVLQDWGASATYTFTPATEGLYEYNVKMRSTGCAAQPQMKKISFYVGFGGNVTVTNINCHVPTGTINVNNAFGTGAFVNWYANDFTSAVLTPAQATLHQDAAITGGRLVVTPSATSKKGGFTILNPSGFQGTNTDYEISFNLTADTPINVYGTGGADGLAYSFGPDANYSNTTGNPCSGFGSKLRISFDAADNSGDNGNRAGMYLTYGYAGNLQIGPAAATTLGYVSNTSLWKLRTDSPVKIKITADGKLTMTVNDTVVFNQIQLPAEFQSADKTTWKHLFSAQTGGDALRHAVDNLSIKYNNINYGYTAGGAGTPPSTWQNTGSFSGLAAGSYDVYLSNPDDAACNKLLGTYQVVDENPVVELGNDTLLCSGHSFVLNAGNPGSTYQWSDNSSAQTLTVTGAGTFWVNVTDAAGCQASDIINVTGGQTPLLSLGNDTTICNGTTLVLDAGTDADTYLWSNSSTGQTLNVTAAGNYSVTITNADGCTNTDHVQVTVLALPEIAGIGAAVSGLGVNFTAQNPADVFLYEWNFGDGNSITNISPNIHYNYAACGTYHVTLTVSNNNQCGTNTETKTIVLECAGIKENDLSGGMYLYPNPASGFIRLANPNEVQVDGITVYDAAGKQMFRSAGATVTMPDITGWASGMYLMKVDATGKTFTQRFIIGR